MFDAKYDSLFVEERAVKEIDSFWEYFVSQEDELIVSLYRKDRNYILSFEKRLERVFFRNKKKLRYTFEKREETIYFTLFYGHSSYLLTVGNELFNSASKKLKNKWAFILKK